MDERTFETGFIRSNLCKTNTEWKPAHSDSSEKMMIKMVVVMVKIKPMIIII